ncbi:MAG: type II toxin-antitoxin system HicB family antitoxin [Alphaproteobacteria bacterium]|nr:type II toxin-antitoxin system HicB family antitoxin [Alphaproteobacteria bacterium]
MKNNNYIALFEQDKETGKYGVVVPDFPGFSSVADSFESAVQSATEGLASHIEVMKDIGEDIPEPSTLDEIKKNWSGWKSWVKDVPDYMTAIIPAIPEYGTQKILISMDSRLVARIDRISKNRSAFVSSAVEYMLDGDNKKRAVA